MKHPLGCLLLPRDRSPAKTQWPQGQFDILPTLPQKRHQSQLVPSLPMEAKHQKNRHLIFQPTSPFHSGLRGLRFWPAGGLWDLWRFGAISSDFRGGKWPVYWRPMDNTRALASYMYPVAACAAPKPPFPSAQQVANSETFAGFQRAFCCRHGSGRRQCVEKPVVRWFKPRSWLALRGVG